MKSSLGKQCRKLFREFMKRELPLFQEDKHQIVPPGCPAFTEKRRSDLFFHIFLYIASDDDEFTIEGSWSTDGRMQTSIGPGDKEAKMLVPSRWRITALWQEHGWDHWWKLVVNPNEHPFDRAMREIKSEDDECMHLVEPATRDAGEKIKQYMLPYFEKIASLH